MPEVFYMPDPVLVHNNIAVFNTYRHNRQDDPRDYSFTTCPEEPEEYAPHTFDVRDHVSLAEPDATIREVLLALLDAPEHLPLSKGETVKDICFTGDGFFKTTPEQDCAFYLAVCIEAQMSNYYPSVVINNIQMPNGREMGIYCVPEKNGGGLSLRVYPHFLDPHDFETLIKKDPLRVIQSPGVCRTDLIRQCCDALNVKVPTQLRPPLSDRLTDAKQRTDAANDQQAAAPQHETPPQSPV